MDYVIVYLVVAVAMFLLFKVGAFRYDLFLMPFASAHTEHRSAGGLTVRHYSSYYVFGLRIVRLHRNKD